MRERFWKIVLYKVGHALSKYVHTMQLYANTECQHVNDVTTVQSYNIATGTVCILTVLSVHAHSMCSVEL